MSNLKRLSLLPEAEISDLYARPVFNKIEQVLYFDMNPNEIDALSQFGTIKTKVYFILQLAYFKAKTQFFTFTFEDTLTDVKYVLSKFFRGTDKTFHGSITRQLIYQQKQVILNLFNYQDWSTEQASLIEAHICELLRYYPKSHDTFRQLLVYFDNQKIVIPSYRNLQDLFTNAFSKENDRINQLMISISPSHQERLSELINREDGITKLNIVRSDQKNFKYTATSTEVEKALEITDLYLFSKDFLPNLLLSKNAIRYYAGLCRK